LRYGFSSQQVFAANRNSGHDAVTALEHFVYFAKERVCCHRATKERAEFEDSHDELGLILFHLAENSSLQRSSFAAKQEWIHQDVSSCAFSEGVVEDLRLRAEHEHLIIRIGMQGEIATNFFRFREWLSAVKAPTF